MGNLSKGVSSDSSNVGAKWPERKSRAEAQSLKPSPPLSSGVCSCGMAKAPSATTGVSFNNSRRLMVLNLRLSVRECISRSPCKRQETEIICDLRISKKLQGNRVVVQFSERGYGESLAVKLHHYLDFKLHHDQKSGPMPSPACLLAAGGNRWDNSAASGGCAMTVQQIVEVVVIV